MRGEGEGEEKNNDCELLRGRNIFLYSRLLQRLLRYTKNMASFAEVDALTFFFFKMKGCLSASFLFFY